MKWEDRTLINAPPPKKKTYVDGTQIYRYMYKTMIEIKIKILKCVVSRSNTEVVSLKE